ncbi:MAG: amidohydrolase family protein [Acidimicrobiia bacterium]|nr:amidohydrolase family protein [Acidimicrobiia bacterium]
MTDLVITASTVITVDAERRVIDQGAVAITGDRVVAVGDAADIVNAHPSARRLDFPDGVVLPGLVDAHGHAGHSLIRTMADDLAAWMAACEAVYLHGAVPQFWRADARLMALERLLAGTTTSLSMLGGAGDTIRADDPAHGSAHLDGVAEIGVRSVMAVGPGAPPFPKTTTGPTGSLATTFDGQMEVVGELVERYRDHPTSSVALTYPTLSMRDVTEPVDAELVRGASAVRELSDAADLLIVQDGHRADTVAASDRLGLLSARSLFSHSIDLEPGHIEALANAGAAVAHNPSAIYSQFGRCPVPELLEAGVTVGLGSDATAPDRSVDMFRHMFQLTRYHRADRRDPSLFPPGTTLELATIGSATALGLGDHLGSLEAGKLADIVVVDAAKPHLTPLTHPVHQLVYFATGADVDTVIVGGKVLMENRQVAHVEIPEVLSEARDAQTAAFARVGIDPSPDREGMWGSVRYADGPGLDL